MSGTSNSPGLLEVINMAIDRFMADVHTSMPGKIVDYDSATQSATVQPSLKRTYVGGQPQLLPKILKVPVIFPSFSGGWLRFPLAAGDNVLLLFSERSIDSWWEQGGEVSPGAPHRFNLSDAIAIPGLNPSKAPITPHGAPGSVELANGRGYIEITQSGQFKLKNDSAELLATLDSILTNLLALKTINCVVGSPVTLSPDTILQLGMDKAKLAFLKAP